MGTTGEHEVARRLEGLPGSWTALHNVGVPDERWSVGHLVIGPPGVFAIDSKTYKERVRVSGDTLWTGDTPRTPDLLTTKQHVETMATALGVEILPALCIHSAPLPSIRLTVEGVTVFAPEGLVPWLRGRPPRLLDMEVTALIAAARQRLEVRGL